MLKFLLTHSLARLRTPSLRSLGSLGKPAFGQLALAKLLLQFTRGICFANKFFNETFTLACCLGFGRAKLVLALAQLRPLISPRLLAA